MNTTTTAAPAESTALLNGVAATAWVDIEDPYAGTKTAIRYNPENTGNRTYMRHRALIRTLYKARTNTLIFALSRRIKAIEAAAIA